MLIKLLFYSENCCLFGFGLIDFYCCLIGCPIMTPNEYLQRHDRVGQYVYWLLTIYVSTIMHHMLRAGTNTSHRKS